jgi:site-specific recombinase
MATIAMVTTAASTAESMMTMNQAARFAACGEGWVIPMVLIKAFAMNWMNFMSVRWVGGRNSSRNRAARMFLRRLNRKGLACIY